MQSWGTRSRFDDRDTERFPSKSGVVGLLCAALGRPRDEPVADLAALRMAVREDRRGVLSTDYQTAEEVAKASGAAPGTVVSRRHYLADAQFLVGLEGEEALLRALHAALAAPHWPLCLGRKAFPPGAPVHLPDGLRSGPLEKEMGHYPWLPAFLSPGKRGPEGPLLVQWECGPGEEGELRQDVPLSFAPRRFAGRRVRYEEIQLKEGTYDVSEPGFD
jgi:CRISPR system Cascade subunit CasD